MAARTAVVDWACTNRNTNLITYPRELGAKKVCNCDVRLLAALNGLNSIAMSPRYVLLPAFSPPSHFYNVNVPVRNDHQRHK